MSRIEADKVVIGDSLVIKDSLMKQRENQVTAKINDILADAQAKADKILAKAQSDADNIKEIALNGIKDELEQIRAQARLDGLEQGKQEIFAQFETQLSEKLQELTNFVDAAFVSKNEILQSADREIIDIIMMISRKIFTSGLKLDEDYLLNYVHSAVKSLRNKEQIKFIVNPQEAERLYNISEKLTEKINELEDISIITDSNIAPDCLIVESLKSRVYTNLDDELNEVETQLKKEYKLGEKTLEATIEQVEYTIEEDIDENAENPDENQDEEVTDEVVTDVEVVEDKVAENENIVQQPVETEVIEDKSVETDILKSAEVETVTQADIQEQEVDKTEDNEEFQPLILNEIKEVEVQEEIKPEMQVDDESSGL